MSYGEAVVISVAIVIVMAGAPLLLLAYGELLYDAVNWVRQKLGG